MDLKEMYYSEILNVHGLMEKSEKRYKELLVQHLLLKDESFWIDYLEKNILGCLYFMQAVREKKEHVLFEDYEGESFDINDEEAEKRLGLGEEYADALYDYKNSAGIADLVELGYTYEKGPKKLYLSLINCEMEYISDYRCGYVYSLKDGIETIAPVMEKVFEKNKDYFLEAFRKELV
jgi:hypothetical protein